MKKWTRVVSLLCAGALVFSAFSGYPVNFSKLISAEAAEDTTQEQVLISKSSTWKYSDADTDMYAQSFFATDFNDSAWSTGTAPLGYPATDYNDTFGAISTGTLVNGTKPAILTYYFRNTFTVSNLADFSSLKATVGFDDGFVLYINGTEVNRTYISEGSVGHSTAANYVNEPSDASGTTQLDLTSYLNLLVEGENTIAVSVHNRDANSSDIYFAMELIAGTADITPSQLNSHFGDDASTEINITYTTIDEADTVIHYGIKGEEESLTAEGTHSQGSSNKWFHAIALTNLQPDTWYTYTVGVEGGTKTGSFKTAPAEGSDETIKFAYLADTQVSNATNAKALGATLYEVSQIEDLDFVYLAGDQTDTATNETQWELLFENSGLFPTGGADLFANNTIAIVQGNHDNNTMNRHINAPAEEGNIVYSFDYGPATFIMLNLETARYDADAREEQKAYVTQVATEAKARGQWVVVGFHKSLYTGASHIVDSDIVEARKYWAPVFIELDVDLVLQGHDHVYSRGFVDSEGQKATVVKESDNVVIDPLNIPMYMVGGHAGGLKWYSQKTYTVSAGDPLALGYSFLDVNSTDTGSDVKKEQVITEIEISSTEFTVNAYMFKYDTDTDTITTEKYLYDTITVKREIAQAEITGSEVGVTETGSTVTYNVHLDQTDGANAYQFTASYDPDKLTFVKGESLLENTVVSEITAENGVVSGTIGTSTANTAASGDIVKLTFTVNQGLTAGTTAVELTQFKSASANDEGTNAEYNLITITGEEAETTIHSYQSASDINGDGQVTLLDLSIALANFQKQDQTACDIDLDGVVNTADYILLLSYMTK